MTLRDEEAIKLADKNIDGNSELIPIRMKKDSIAKIPRGMDNKQLSELQKRLVEIISTTTIDMIEGNISVSPLCDKDIDACAYCDYVTVCGFDQKLSKSRKLDYDRQDKEAKNNNEGGEQ